MLQAGGQLDLTQEALTAQRHGDLRAQRLQGQEALVLGIAGQVHGGHAATPQLAIDDVPIAERGVQLCNWVGRISHAGNVRPAWRGGYVAGFTGWLWRTCSASCAASPSGSAAGQRIRTPKRTLVVVASIARRLTRTESVRPDSESTRPYTARPAPVWRASSTAEISGVGALRQVAATTVCGTAASGAPLRRSVSAVARPTRQRSSPAPCPAKMSNGATATRAGFGACVRAYRTNDTAPATIR